MDVNLICSLCAEELAVSEITEPVIIHGLMQTWREVHQHSELELKMYHDAEIAVRQYQHSTPYAGNFDEGDDD